MALDQLDQRMSSLGPAFSVYGNVGVSIPTATWTKVLFQVEDFDLGNSYDSTTSKFQPNVAGYYQLSAQVTPGGSGSSEKGIYLYKNGSQHAIGSDGVGWTMSGGWLIYLNGTTDYVEIYAYQGTGGTTTSSTGRGNCNFQGFLARAA